MSILNLVHYNNLKRLNVVKNIANYSEGVNKKVIKELV